MTAKKKISKKPAPRGKAKNAATSAAILGRPVAKASAGVDLKKVKREWQKFCLHLLELREQLTKQMNGLAAESARRFEAGVPALLQMRPQRRAIALR